MISVTEAERLIAKVSLPFLVETVPLEHSLSRIVAFDLRADRDQPPFHRAAMDGIAINSEASKRRNEFRILGTISAGEPRSKLNDSKACFEVMTGAAIPEGADKVVRYEEIEIADQIARLKIDHTLANDNVHEQGSDYKKDELVVPKGIMINSTIAGILATIGVKEVPVFRAPRIIIIGTGDELVAVEAIPLPHQIRWSNAIALSMELKSYGFNEIVLHHLQDDFDLSLQHFKQYLQTFDLVIVTGGVSAGKFDFIPEVLKTCGVDILFHKVAQRPGKPLLFGTYNQNCVVFGLPGNPVSCLTSLRRYVIPWLTKQKSYHWIPMAKTIEFNKSFTLYKAVKLIESEDMSLVAMPIDGNGSGDFFHLRDSTGFIELPAEQNIFLKGEFVRYYSWGRV